VKLPPVVDPVEDGDVKPDEAEESDAPDDVELPDDPEVAVPTDCEAEVGDVTRPGIVVDTGVKAPYDVVILPSDRVEIAKDRDSVMLVTRPSERVAAKTPKSSVLLKLPVVVVESVVEPLAKPVEVFDAESEEVALALTGKTEKDVKVEEPLVMSTGEDVSEVVRVPFGFATEAAEMMAGTRLVG